MTYCIEVVVHRKYVSSFEYARKKRFQRSHLKMLQENVQNANVEIKEFAAKNSVFVELFKTE